MAGAGALAEAEDSFFRNPSRSNQVCGFGSVVPGCTQMGAVGFADEELLGAMAGPGRAGPLVGAEPGRCGAEPGARDAEVGAEA